MSVPIEAFPQCTDSPETLMAVQIKTDGCSANSSSV